MTANRHERRWQTKIVERRQISLSDITGVRCGWRGCPAFHALDQSPDGWTHLISHATSPDQAVFNIDVGGRQRPVLDLGSLDWRHDVTLCPEHTQRLAELLYADPGADPLLSETTGRA